MNLRGLLAAGVLVGGVYFVTRELGLGLGLPLPRGSWRVTSPFGPRSHPITGEPSHHDGIDLGADTGTPIYAVDSGEVIATTASLTEGSGISATIQSGGKQWKYKHMSERYVKKGDKVARGDVLGLVGSTGTSTGPHLHLEVSDRDGNVIDPAKLIRGLA